MTMYEEDQYTTVKVPETRGKTPEENAIYDLMVGIREIVKARPAYAEAHAFYDASIEEWFAGNNRIVQVLRKTGNEYKFKLAAVPVHTLSERVKMKGIKIDAKAAEKREVKSAADSFNELNNGADATSGSDTPADKEPEQNPKQEAWDKIWKANNLQVWVPEFHERTFEYGDSYVFVWETPDRETTDDDELEAGVVMVWNSPMGARKIYDTEEPNRALFDIKYYKIDKFYYADLYYRDSIWHFRTKVKESLGFDHTQWELNPLLDVDTGEEIEPATVPNPFGELPLKHCRNGLPYGTPEHANAYGPQRAIAKMLITQIATVESHGWPTRYALTDPEAALNEASDTPPWDDDETAGTMDAEEIRRRQPLQGGPGVLQYLNGVKSAGQWDAADPKVFTDPTLLYMDLMATLTRTPFYQFKPGGEQPSGKARQVADAPFNSKKENRQDHLQDFWEEVVTFSLKILDIDKPESIEVIWAPSDMASDYEDWQMIEKMLQTGVPFEMAMLKAGFDEETIAKWKPEDGGMLEAATVLGTLGDAITKMGAASQQGVLTPEQASAIIAKVLAPYGVLIDFAEVEAVKEEQDALEAEQMQAQMDHEMSMAKERGGPSGSSRGSGASGGNSQKPGGSGSSGKR